MFLSYLNLLVKATLFARSKAEPERLRVFSSAMMVVKNYSFLFADSFISTSTRCQGFRAAFGNLIVQSRKVMIDRKN